MRVHRYWQGLPPAVDYANRFTALGMQVHTWGPDTLSAEWADLAAATAHLVVPTRQAHHVANVARLGLLFDHGGWWADHDLEPLRPWSALPAPASGAYSWGDRCSCWLAFRRHHPLLRVALQSIAATPDGPPRTAVEVSGEAMLGRVWPPSVASVPVAGWARHHGWTARLRSTP